MNISTKTSDPIVAPTSPEETRVKEFLIMVDSRLGQGVNQIQIDCTPLARVTSSHINALWLAREKCDRRRVAIELLNVSNGLRRVLEALDLAALFLPESAMPLRFDLEFVPTVEDIDRAMSKVVGFLVKSGIPEVTAFEIQTIFYEVATNIRRHGQLLSEDSIRFDARIKERMVTFTFEDGGVPFDPMSYNANVDFRKASHELRRNGFGLAMIVRLSDSQEYSRTTDARNRLTIKKAW